MSDRLELWEIRKGSEDDWEHTCFCASEEQAEKLKKVLAHDYAEDYFVVHVEVVASVDIDIQEY